MVPIFPLAPLPETLFPNNRRGRRDAAKLAQRQRTQERIAKRMVDDLMPAIRADGKRARTLTIKVRYPGMEDSSCGRSLPEATDLEAPFYPLVGELLRDPGTHVYVCGLRAMEDGVLLALADGARGAGLDWEACALAMEREGRLHLETY